MHCPSTKFSTLVGTVVDDVNIVAINDGVDKLVLYEYSMHTVYILLIF